MILNFVLITAFLITVIMMYNTSKKKDDVILKWDDEPMSDFGELLTKLREKNPGDVVILHIKRDGFEQDVKVTLKASEE